MLIVCRHSPQPLQEDCVWSLSFVARFQNKKIKVSTSISCLLNLFTFHYLIALISAQESQI